MGLYDDDDDDDEEEEEEDCFFFFFQRNCYRYNDALRKHESDYLLTVL